jgi:Protein of unknown function (DUF3833)
MISQSRIVANSSMHDLIFDPLVFFAGDIKCSGFLADRFGKIRRSFIIEFQGVKSGEKLDVNEIMYFNDGEIANRQWQFWNTGLAHWCATANDIPGSINIRHGETSRESRWSYAMPLPIGGRPVSLDFEDIMTLTTQDEMTALTNITKFGLRVAQMVSTYSRG